MPSCSANSISQSASGSPSAPNIGPFSAAGASSFGAAADFAEAFAATGAAGLVCSRIMSMSSAFFARDADLTPSAAAIATNCSRSFASNADCSRAPLATGPAFTGIHRNREMPFQPQLLDAILWRRMLRGLRSGIRVVTDDSRLISRVTTRIPIYE